MTAWRMVTCAVACAATTATAQPTGEPPTTVLGIPLGVPASTLQFPKCRDMNPVNQTETCFFPLSDRFIEFYGTPKLSFKYVISGKVFRGTLASVTLSLDSSSFDQAIEVLTTRYGPPTISEVSEVIAGSGARLNSRHVAWAWPDHLITASERAGRVSQALVTFAHRPSIEAEQAEAAARTKESAGKL